MKPYRETYLKFILRMTRNGNITDNVLPDRESEFTISKPLVRNEKDI